jgi:hypothetical protein
MLLPVSLGEKQLESIEVKFNFLCHALGAHAANGHLKVEIDPILQAV